MKVVSYSASISDESSSTSATNASKKQLSKDEKLANELGLEVEQVFVIPKFVIHDDVVICSIMNFEL